MSRRLTLATSLFASTLSVTAVAQSTTNICPDNNFSWGENIGWMNWSDANAGDQGVRVFADHLKGFIWCENVGWVNVGAGGGPYANTSGSDFGVNINPLTGEMSGLAWGENIGWINFGTEPFAPGQGAMYDDAARRFRGYAWGENVGWINLDSPIHFVAALPGDTNGDGLVDFSDLNNVLSQYAQTGELSGDVSGDQLVDFADLNAVLSNYAQSC